MGDSLAASHRSAYLGEVIAVVLAAGEGRRLRPLTLVRPKPLCPVGGVPLLDLALERAGRAAAACSVNIHHGRAALEAHLAANHPGVHVSVEAEQALGTAGALGKLRDWIGGRATLVVNADTWAEADLATFVAGWDGERVRLLVGGEPVFGPRMAVAAALLPWADVAALSPEPSGLYERCWSAANDAGRVEVVGHPGPVVDCGTPAGYLRANLLAAERSGGSIVAPTADVSGSVERSVIGEEARVAGTVRDSVLWAGVEVAPAELLERAVRATERVTVLVR